MRNLPEIDCIGFVTTKNTKLGEVSMRLRDRRFLMISLAIVLGISACTPAHTLPTNTASPTNQSVKPVNPQSKPIVEFRVQKPGTENQFLAQNRVLQQLLAEQKELEKKGDRVAIKKNETSIERTNKEIISLFEPSKLDDRDITQALQQAGGESWNVNVLFTEEGGKKFAQMTKDLAGTGRSIGIFYQGKLISAPTVSPQFSKTGITGGAAVIEGNFTAKESYELARKLDERASLSPERKPMTLVELGNDLHDKKDFQGAISKFSEAIKLDPKNIVAYLARGDAKASLKKWQEAIEDYQQVLAIDSNNIKAYIGRARAKEALKDYRGAIADYEKVYFNKENNTIVYSPLLRNYILVGKKQEALNLIENIFESGFQGDTSNQTQIYRHFLKAIVLIYFQDYKTAISGFDRAIALEPQYNASYLYRGIAYEKLGDRQAAIKDYQKAVAIKPEDAIPQRFAKENTGNDQVSEITQIAYYNVLSQAYFFRGVAYSKLEDWKSAKQDLDKAIALGSTNSDTYQQRSLVRQKLKDEVGAKEDADKATELLELSGDIALPF
jgi:tetratricopeptide (TPR) repeat protein